VQWPRQHKALQLVAEKFTLRVLLLKAVPEIVGGIILGV